MTVQKRFFFVLLIFLPITSCGGSYVHRVGQARWHARHGNMLEAIQWFQKNKAPARDQLLFLFDHATILSAAGRFEESNRIFAEAEELIEKQGSQILSKSVAVVANDNLIPYHALNFEKALIDLFQALNFLAMKRPEEALIEIRHMNTNFADHFADDAKSYLKSGAIKFAAAEIWEANGKLNDAYIDERWLATHEILTPKLGMKLLAHCQRLRLSHQCQTWKKMFPKEKPLELQSLGGEVVLLIGQGSIPLKESSEAHAGLQIVPVPYYPDDIPTPPIAHIAIDGTKETEAVILEDLAITVRGQLDDEMPEIIARAILRLAAKTSAAVAVGTEGDEDLGLLLGFALLATNRADLRSWTTLPRSFQAATLTLPQGSHTVTITLPTEKQKRVERIIVEAGKKTFVVVRFF